MSDQLSERETEKLENSKFYPKWPTDLRFWAIKSNVHGKIVQKFQEHLRIDYSIEQMWSRLLLMMIAASKYYTDFNSTESQLEMLL